MSRLAEQPVPPAPLRLQPLASGSCALPVWVDELPAYFPAGKLVPMVFHTFSGREQVFIVRPDDRTRYEDMIGRSADLPPVLRSSKRTDQGERIECAADAGGFIQSPRCQEHGIFLVDLVPGRLYCPLCHQRDMNAKGLANHPLPARPEQ